MIDLSISKQLKSSLGDMQLELKLIIEQGNFVTIYGKSGAGKTSLLKILAGLMKPEQGKIIVNGITWIDTSQAIFLKPQKRKVGLVFQDYALFPNMTVQENLQFALGKNGDHTFINALIEIMELGKLVSRKPATLSGGQQQRVALARALVQKPDLLMLDEPFSALDHDMRIKLQHYILQVHEEFGLTILLISHDIPEIFKLSNMLILLDEGKIVQQGSPLEVFKHKELGGKFQFVGQVVAIEKQDVIYIITILIGKDLVKVAVDRNEAASLVPGDRVLAASKAFNPVIKKI